MNNHITYRLAVLSVTVFLACSIPIQSQGDEWDPMNDTPQGAVNLGTPSGDEIVQGPLTLSGTDLADWFRFLLNKNETYEFYTVGFSDTVGELYRSDGVSVVAMNDEYGPDPNFRIRYTAAETGEFYLKVRLFEENREGTYYLHYINRSSGMEPDEWDPADNAYGGAADLGTPSPEEHTHGPHTLSSQDRDDWFRFTLREGETYEFYASGNFDTVGDLYRSNGTDRIASADVSRPDPSFYLRFSAVESGIYYLRVRMSEEALSGKYTLHYRSGAEPVPEGDEWDPADDIFDGASLLGTPTFQEQQHGPHSLSDTDHFDWFQFVLQPGATYEFLTTDDSDTIGDLFSSDGTTQLSTDDNGGEKKNFKILFTVGEYGEYFLRVRESGSGDATYTLAYRLVSVAPPPVVDEWDPSDDDVQGATLLDPSSAQLLTHGPHTLSTADSYDWFQLTLEAGTTYEFRTTGSADTYGSLLAPDGMTTIAEQDDGGTGYNFHIRYTPVMNGTYYLCVRLYDLGSNGSYVLNVVRVVEPSPLGDEWDPSDDVFTGATELDPPSAFETIHGPHRLSPTDSADWFQVYLVAGAAFEIFSRGESDTLATLYFGDENTQIIQKDEGGNGNNFSIRITPSKSGLYYLRVSEFGGGDATYTLHLRGEPKSTGLLSPFRVYAFDSVDEYTVFPGGFINEPGGRAELGPIPEAIGYSDGQGAIVTAQPGEVVLLLFPTVNVGDNPVLVRAAVQSTGPSAEVTLAVLDGSMDGSITTNTISNSSLLRDRYQYRVLLYNLPGTSIAPVFQLSNLSGDREVTVYLDNLAIYLLPEEGSVPGWLLSFEGTSRNMRPASLKPIQTFSFEAPSEYSEVPGGFIHAPGGTVGVGDTPSEIGHSDGRGVIIAADEEEVTLLMLPEVETDAGTILIRASVQSSGPGAAIAVAAMDNATEPSISTNIIADSAIYSPGYERVVLLFQPHTDAVIPIFQAAHHAGEPRTTVFMDTFEVFLLPSDALIPVKLLNGD